MNEPTPARGDLLRVGQSTEWQTILSEGHGSFVRARRLFRYLPSAPRCKVCNNPFQGVGGVFMGLAGFRPSRKNPNLCSRCCDRLPVGGAEVDIAVLFADIRGSTALGETAEPGAFAAILSRFYATASRTLLAHDAVVDKLIGDEVMAFFVRGISGKEYRRHAVDAGVELLRAVGYGSAAGPWLELGVAVNAGTAFVGNVGDAVVDFTALGDPVNVAARMQRTAAPGQLLVADTVEPELLTHAPRQRLVVSGREQPITVCILSSRGSVPGVT